MLPLWTRVDLGVMAMKGYSTFTKAPALLEPHHQIVWCHIQDTCGDGGEVLLLIRKMVYSTAPADWANCLRSINELIGNVLLTLTHGCASVGWPAKTNLHQLCVDTECSLENLPGAMDDRDRWKEKESGICTVSVTWWMFRLETIVLHHLKPPFSLFSDLPIISVFCHLRWRTLSLKPPLFECWSVTSTGNRHGSEKAVIWRS